jgi:lysophospholipase L1-like esterase
VSSRIRRVKLLCLSLLVLAVLLAILFGCLELTFRYLDLKDVSELPYHGENGTYVPLIMKRNYNGLIDGIPVTMNQYGLRDEPNFNPNPSADEFRILSMGDSVAFGLGIHASDCYAKVLARRLNEAGGPIKYNVINSAGPGYSPSFYYLFLKNEALQWHPRMVLMEIELCNDVTDEALLKWEVDPAATDRPVRLRGGRYVVAWDGILLSAYIHGPYFYEKTYTYVELSRRFFDILYRLAPTEPFHSDPSVTYYILGYDRYLLDRKRIEYGWEHLFGALQATQEMLRARKISFLLMIMPSRFIYRKSAERHADLFARSLVDRASAQAEKCGIPFVDFTDTIGAGGGDALYRDDIHLNEKGNLLVGNALFDQIKKEVTPPVSAP